MLRIFKDAKMYLKMKNEVPNNLNLLSTLVWSSNRWTFFIVQRSEPRSEWRYNNNNKVSKTKSTCEVFFFVVVVDLMKMRKRYTLFEFKFFKETKN